MIVQVDLITRSCLALKDEPLQKRPYKTISASTLRRIDDVKRCADSMICAILMSMNPSRTDPKNRKSIRFPEYDYSQPGAYFVTILTYQRQPLFGSLVNGLMELSALGELAVSVWSGLPSRFAEVEIDEFIVMPDHFHGILLLNEGFIQTYDSLCLKTSTRRSLGSIIGTFKSTVSKVYHFNNPGNNEPIWHRNYFERIIRDERELNDIREYILNNPVRSDVEE